MDKLMKLTECAAVSNIAEQVYTLASQGVSVDSISSTVFSDLTEADGPIYGLLKSTIQMTSEEVTAMLDDPNAIDLEVSQLSRLWSAEVFKLCNADQL